MASAKKPSESADEATPLRSFEEAYVTYFEGCQEAWLNAQKGCQEAWSQYHRSLCEAWTSPEPQKVLEEAETQLHKALTEVDEKAKRSFDEGYQRYGSSIQEAVTRNDLARLDPGVLYNIGASVQSVACHRIGTLS